MGHNLILCGKVVKPHGLKGELGIIFYSDSPFFIQNFSLLYLKLGRNSPLPFKILGWRLHQNKYLVQLANISDRTAAEKWRGAEVYVLEKELPPKEEGEFYLYELIGWQVYLQNGDYLGIIKDIKVIGENEIWEITTSHQEEVLFPATEEFVIELVEQEKKAIIAPPEGLLEIYLK